MPAGAAGEAGPAQGAHRRCSALGPALLLPVHSETGIGFSNTLLNTSRRHTQQHYHIPLGTSTLDDFTAVNFVIIRIASDPRLFLEPHPEVTGCPFCPYQRKQWTKYTKHSCVTKDENGAVTKQVPTQTHLLMKEGIHHLQHLTHSAAISILKLNQISRSTTGCQESSVSRR